MVDESDSCSRVQEIFGGGTIHLSGYDKIAVLRDHGDCVIRCRSVAPSWTGTATRKMSRLTTFMTNNRIWAIYRSRCRSRGKSWGRGGLFVVLASQADLVSPS